MRSHDDDRLERALLDGMRQVLREELRDLRLTKKEEAPEDPWLTVAEAAKHANRHHTTIRAWIADGSLRAYKCDKSYNIKLSDLERAIMREPVQVRK